MDERKLSELIDQAKDENWSELNLSNRKITIIPTKIGDLTNLQQLYLGNNLITSIPIEIGTLKNLQKLYLSSNQITFIPAEIRKLRNLQELYLSRNRITAIPTEIEKLTKLQILDLSRNQITVIPTAIWKLTNLNRLVLADNPVIKIPPEIISQGWGEKTTEDGNPQAIFDYLKQQATGTRPLLEAKVLFLGEAGVGKTSLIQQLLDGTICDPSSPKTEGINVTNWQIKIPADKEVDQDSSIRLNLWDFGGQDIMHSTHQFFLTKRSLYLLILNSRQNDRQNRIEYWLRIIQSFGGDSPILIVCNQIDQHTPKIDEYRLRADYPQIKNILYTSCYTGVGIKELGSEIATQIRQLQHVYDFIPENYFTIKKHLENLAEQKNYIPYERYQELCDQYNLAETSSQEILIKLLHDLGTVLNYKDDTRLSDTSVLNPRWVTQAVYKILNDPNLIISADGLLTHNALRQILNDSQIYPKEKYRFLSDLMGKFEICFPIDDSHQTFLFPDLLSPTEPPTDFDWNNSLQFRYSYPRVLPPSIISRFIVRIHRLIYDSLHWCNGVVLQDQNQNIALVHSNEEDRWIEIKIVGKSRRNLLEIIRHDFDHIHTTLVGINVEEKIKISRDNHIWEDYRFLVILEHEGEIDWRPSSDPKNKYNIRQILDGFETPENRKMRYRDFYNIQGDLINGDKANGDKVGGDNRKYEVTKRTFITQRRSIVSTVFLVLFLLLIALSLSFLTGFPNFAGEIRLSQVNRAVRIYDQG